MTNLQSVMSESRKFAASQEFRAKARIKDNVELAALVAHAERDPEGFWRDLATTHLSWQTPFTEVLNRDRAPHFTWFNGGTLNVSYNCLDRHLEARGDKLALLCESEAGEVRRFTYRALHQEVCKLANVLRGLGVGHGDRVVILLPNGPEAVIAMQACARLGAIHSVVFGGFSAESLKDRIEDAGAVLLITADGFERGGRHVALKQTADKALARGGACIKNVLVVRRSGSPVSMQAGRDLWWHERMADASSTCAPVWVDSEQPLYLLYTSGSTGKPKGIVHSSAGYLLGALTSMLWVFDLRDDDVYWCTADVGWVTGHSYVVYGPLALGATVVMYEGAPTVPEGDRFWDICQRFGVSIFYTAPTAIRALMRLGEALPNKHDLSRLRLLGSVGEPINPEAWMWYHTVIGKERCPIVDTWWQTETGSMMIAPVPAAVPTKPGSCTTPLPGIAADIVDDAGALVVGDAHGGYLVIKEPWPSMLRTIWGDDARYVETYWSRFGGKYYVAGDGAHRDKDGYFWIMGRIDDVLNVSGHRLGTMEIESALSASALVAEAAVVGRPDAVKGESVFAYVVLRASRPAGGHDDALVQTLRAWVGEQIGSLAKPDTIRFVENLPKTRSGKIMRRLLRAIARGETIQEDISTLENEAIVRQLEGKA